MSIKVQDTVYRLKKETTLQTGLTFARGEEFHIVYDVVYMKGFPVPANLQATLYNWITTNPSLFQIDHRKF